jgi:hypothetical protein
LASRAGSFPILLVLALILYRLTQGGDDLLPPIPSAGIGYAEMLGNLLKTGSLPDGRPYAALTDGQLLRRRGKPFLVLVLLGNQDGVPADPGRGLVSTQKARQLTSLRTQPRHRVQRLAGMFPIPLHGPGKIAETAAGYLEKKYLEGIILTGADAGRIKGRDGFAKSKEDLLLRVPAVFRPHVPGLTWLSDPMLQPSPVTQSQPVQRRLAISLLRPRDQFLISQRLQGR